MKLLDLSLEIEPAVSEPEPVEITYISHRQGAEILGKKIGLKAENFPDHMALSLERISITSHSGTHFDAPSHYGPFCENKKAKDICEIPLEWCYQPGIIINCCVNNEFPVSKKEIINFIEIKNIKLSPLNIVFIYTGADKLWGTKEYFTNFRGISLEATQWLIDQGIKIIGVDSFGFDPPFHRMLETYQRTKNAEDLWPAHVWGRKKEYCQIERLKNLEHLIALEKFMISCFPIKIKNAGAGWVRVVAMIENENS